MEQPDGHFLFRHEGFETLADFLGHGHIGIHLLLIGRTLFAENAEGGDAPAGRMFLVKRGDAHDLAQIASDKYAVFRHLDLRDRHRYTPWFNRSMANPISESSETFNSSFPASSSIALML